MPPIVRKRIDRNAPLPYWDSFPIAGKTLVQYQVDPDQITLTFVPDLTAAEEEVVQRLLWQDFGCEPSEGMKAAKVLFKTGVGALPPATRDVLLELIKALGW